MLTRLKYTYQASARDQLWLPLGLWLFFALLCGLFFDDDRSTKVSIAFLGSVLPLLAGVLAAYTILNDSALELQFATRQTALRMLLERIGLVLLLVTLTALSFQGFAELIGIKLSGLGGFSTRQLAWLIPCLFSIAIGCTTALWGRNATIGASAASLLWLIQIMTRSWFSSHKFLQYGFLFQAMMQEPGSKPLIANQLALTALSAFLFLTSVWMLKRQEQYL